MKKTAALAILEQLAAENRRVLADWRAAILLRRASAAIPPAGRRWARAPRSVDEVVPLLRQMQHRGELAPLPEIPGLFEVTVPYARTGLVEEDEILMEVHPYAALSYLSALVFHGLTDELPKTIFASIPTEGRGGLLPPGTDVRDWQEFALARGRTPARILDRPVRWMTSKPERYFGVAEYRPRGYPVRVTTPERTLLDGLLHPEWCGGLEAVLRAWVLAADRLDLDALVADVERLNGRVLCRRAGFVMDELGLDHPALAAWRQGARRGGASKLLGSAPYAPTFSEPWRLSLNAPIAALRERVA